MGLLMQSVKYRQHNDSRKYHKKKQEKTHIVKYFSVHHALVTLAVFRLIIFLFLCKMLCCEKRIFNAMPI